MLELGERFIHFASEIPVDKPMTKLTFKLLGFSFIGLVATMLIGMFAGTMIPEYVNLDTGDVVEKLSAPRNRHYAKEEMDKADREFDQKIKQFIKREKEKPPYKFLREARRSGVLFSWLPWILIPWLGRAKKIQHVLFLAVFPALGFVSGLLYPIELLLCLSAMLLGFWGYVSRGGKKARK